MSTHKYFMNLLINATKLSSSEFSSKIIVGYDDFETISEGFTPVDIALLGSLLADRKYKNVLILCDWDNQIKSRLQCECNRLHDIYKSNFVLISHK